MVKKKAADGSVTLKAEPQSLAVDPKRTAMVIVDMQNSFAKKGGLFDMAGSDLSEVPAAAAAINRVTTALRKAGGKVVYVVHLYSPDLHEAGAPDSSNVIKSGITRISREKPELRDKLAICGCWGGEVIPEIAPKKGDYIVEKIRHSGFYETNLDTTLKTLDAKFVLFAGTELSMCVEGTLRDAFYRGYHCVLVSDAAVSSKKYPFRRPATEHNVRMSLGWVTTSADVVKALRG
jgi:ureidoacrylate peracid hydrolase